MIRRAQVTIFVVVAIVIVAAIVIYFYAAASPKADEIPAEVQPVFSYYEECIRTQTSLAISTAGAQGGWIENENYVPGSEYAPFSSQLNFLGTPVKYWYYVAGNGVVKEQVPSKEEIEKQISDFVKRNMQTCDFRELFVQGFNVNYTEPEVKTSLSDNVVSVEVDAQLSAQKNGVSATKKVHTVNIDSKLGKFYQLAKNIYGKEKQDSFLENYALDVLYLYAPVDGVEIQCGPKVWSTQKVISDVRDALENNFAAIKFSGNYYTLKNKDSKYFVVDEKSDESVNVMYSKNWPTKIEIYGNGVDQETMIAQPVGTQEGLGAMGFCYVPYHFVYDLSFPVMIQIYDAKELFQFPVAVVIDKTVPRVAQINDSFDEADSSDFCTYKEKRVNVNVYDINLNKIDANISYECFNQKCFLGQSFGGVFNGFVPACVNGYLSASSSGYASKKQIFSTNKETLAEIFLEKEYELNVSVRVSGSSLRGSAIIIFTKSDGTSRAVTLPGEGKIKLSEDSYDVKAYIFGNSSVSIPASTKLQCVQQPKEGILGFFGSTEEKCFDISTPETKIDYALIGGGSATTYVLESQLKNGNLIIETQEFPHPSSIEQLQQNFELFETRRLNLIFNEKK